MAKAIQINHVALVVSNLEEACKFYEHELGLEPIPAFLLIIPQPSLSSTKNNNCTSPNGRMPTPSGDIFV